MDPVAISALVISAGSALFAFQTARAAAQQAKSVAAQTEIQREQVEAAREQTQLQRKIAQDAAQPYVWADIQPDMQQGTTMQVVVGNSGATIARNVKVIFDPPLPASDSNAEKVVKIQSVLSEGLKSLSPGRTIRWPLGAGYDLLADEMPQVRKVRIEGEGPFGQLPGMEIEIDISQIRLSRDAPDGSLHHVRGAIKELTKAVNGVDKTMKRAAEEMSSTHSEIVETTAISESSVRQEFANLSAPGAMLELNDNKESWRG